MTNVINLQINPNYPRQRTIEHIVQYLKQDMVMAHAGDCGMYLSCLVNSYEAQAKIRILRNLSDKHFLTLVCRDLSELGTYAKVNNSAFRALKSNTPGLCTFVLEATRHAPKKILQAKRKTVGLRIPQTPWLRAVLETLDAPLVSTSLVGHEDLNRFYDYDEMISHLQGMPDLIIDTEQILLEQTTIVDLTTGYPEVLRQGAGDFD